MKEPRNIGRAEAGARRGYFYVWRDLARTDQRVGKAQGVSVDIAVVESGRFGEVDQEPRKQDRIHARSDREKQIRVFSRGGASRIDDNDPRTA